jgi:2,3-bisphosphoglycerate-dependent phosphoglycerate mutase
MERLRILVVRHAQPLAATVDGPAEALRPLTGRGRRQAEELAGELCAARPHTIVSSPYRRAVDTVQPAERCGAPDCRRAGSPVVELDSALASIARAA